MSRLLEIAQAVASVATAIGVLVAGWQLRVSKKQSLVQFEDQMSAQYREIARRLPIEALLGETLDPNRQAKSLADFYHYFDLSNEQAFLHERRRITKATWKEWKEGIEQNLRRPAFALAWDEITRRAPEGFNELRAIVPPATTSRS
jgi:hypothetical protein